MKNHSFRITVVAFWTILTQWACQPIQEAVKPVSHDISLSEARSWLASQQSNARVGGEKRPNSRNEHWDIARKETLADGRAVVVVPLTYNFRQLRALPGSSTATKESLLKSKAEEIQSKLLIFKDAKGEVQAELIHVIPTEEYRKNNRKVDGSSFSGLVLGYDQRGETPLYGYTYKDGKVVNRLKPLSTKNGRLNAQRCGFWLLYPSGSGPNDTPDEFWFMNGQIYEAYFLGVPCAEVSTADDNTGGDPSNGSSADGSWGWGWGYNYDQSTGGGSTGGNGSVGTGGTGDGGLPTGVLTEEGFSSNDPADIFLHFMQVVRQPSVWFTAEEQALIREYPELIASINDHINQYGVKPDGSRAFKLSAEIQQNYPRFANLVRGLPDFVENDPKVKAVLIEFSGISWSEIKPKLKYGSGPELFVTDLLQQEGAKLVGNCTCNGPGTPNRIDRGEICSWIRTSNFDRNSAGYCFPSGCYHST